MESDARYGTGGEDTLAMNERDWLSSIRTCRRPLCDVEDGHKVQVTCNLANMSLRLGRAIRWDAENEHVVGDTEAAAMCYRPYRAPWDDVLRGLVDVCSQQHRGTRAPVGDAKWCCSAASRVWNTHRRPGV